MALFYIENAAWRQACFYSSHASMGDDLSMNVARWSYYFTLALVAARNSWLHRSKNIIIGGLLGLGGFLIVVGYSVLKNVEDSMQESIVGSVAAHLQIYSSAATDPLALFGGGFMGREDIDSIPDYRPVKDLLLNEENVVDVLPMGFEMSILSRGNELDDTFTELRSALQKKVPSDIEETILRAKDQISLLRTELEYELPIASDAEKSGLRLQLGLVDDLAKEPFWQRVGTGDETALMHLEAKIAPLSGEKSPIYLRYLGTDPQHFAKAFQKFKIMEGELTPIGKKGMMLSQRIREDQLKNIVARLFDKIHKKCVMPEKNLLEDAECVRLTKDLSRQYMEILVYLSRGEMQYLVPLLRSQLSQSGEIADLIKNFLLVNPENFIARRSFFYEHIAPRIKLYEISPGEKIVLRTYTKSGYIKTLAVDVYGVFAFEGIEDSDLAGSFNILDLVSFRELYGQMTEASQRELEDLKRETSIEQVTQENIEDQLFGENAVTETTSSGDTQANPIQHDIQIERQLDESYDVQELEAGLALNIAVFLKDKSHLNNTLSTLQKKLDSAGLKVKVVDWRQASGFVGQFVEVIRYVLSISIAIILIVALIIINNTLIVSVHGRTREIGTLRAIGMQRGSVMLLFLVETAVVALMGLIPGALLGIATLSWLNVKGIPAVHDVIVFLFSGPVLRPTLNHAALLIGPLIILILAVLSALWVARQASAISPAKAMQEKE
jgi:ABC-type lipoprotein release transport system permease subunit